MADDNKVLYGLSNVYYSLYDSTTTTFGTPVALPGAVNVSISPEGEETKFYADNIIYYLAHSNTGYTGSIELADLSQAARVALFAQTVDSNGALYETSDVEPPVFALLFEVEGNDHEKRYAFYSCQATRPTVEHSTLESSKDPQTVSADFTVLPLSMTVGEATENVVKSSVENDTEGAAAYATWYTDVYIPGSTLGA